MFLRKEAKDIFGIELPEERGDAFISEWYNITAGNPPWLDPDDDVKSINFAQFVCDVTSGLVVLDIGISLPDTPRGQYLQKIANYTISILDNKVSDALGNAGIMFKPNGDTVDFYAPGNFLITDWDSSHTPTAAIFFDREVIGKETYTKYEYHRFEDVGGVRVYAVSNRAFVSKTASRGDPCQLARVPKWAELMEDAYIENVDIPLFSYYGNPKPNFLDRGSPMKLPIWAICREELRSLDYAVSRKDTEIEDSKHMTIVPVSAIQYADSQHQKLPRFMKGLQLGLNVTDNKPHEHVATLLTEQRIADINANLAMISAKLGFDQGFFVLNEKTGMVTATQVESDDQSTIRTIKNLRDPLRVALMKMLYGANVFADLYSDIPAEDWTRNYDAFTEELADAFNFGDITYSYDEDRARWWGYVQAGAVPKWKYFVKFEGMSEEEAKAMVAEAQPKTPTLFGGEE